MLKYGVSLWHIVSENVLESLWINHSLIRKASFLMACSSHPSIHHIIMLLQTVLSLLVFGHISEVVSSCVISQVLLFLLYQHTLTHILWQI